MNCFDVIIPCFKYGHFLDDCVKSVLNQEGVNVRVLIMDDCSPDNTPQVAAELQKQDNRVEYCRHKENIGHIATYNEGLDWVNGDYVVLISADDMLTPGALARADRLMSAHPEVGLVYGRDIIFETTPLPPFCGPSIDACKWHILAYRDFLEESCRLGHTGIQAPTAVARTEVHKRAGGYLDYLPHTADTEIWLRLAANSAVGVLDSEQAYRRVHQQSMSFLFSSPQRLWEQKRAFDTHFQWCGNKLIDIDGLSTLLTHVLVEKALWSASIAFDHRDVDICDAFIQLAFDLDPLVKNIPLMSRLRIKRMLGPKVWSLFRVPLSRLRNLTKQLPSRTDAGIHCFDSPRDDC